MNADQAYEKITGTVLVPSYLQDRLEEAKRKRVIKLAKLDESLKKQSPELAKALSKLSAFQAGYDVIKSTEKRTKNNLIKASAGVELGEVNQADMLKTEKKLVDLQRRINGLSLAIVTQKQRISEIRDRVRDELIKQYKAEHKIAVQKILKAWEKLSIAGNPNAKHYADYLYQEIVRIYDLPGI